MIPLHLTPVSLLPIQSTITLALVFLWYIHDTLVSYTVRPITQLIYYSPFPSIFLWTFRLHLHLIPVSFATHSSYYSPLFSVFMDIHDTFVSCTSKINFTTN